MKSRLVIDMISELGGLFLSFHGMLFVLSMVFTRFKFFRKILSELYLIKKHDK
jgi:hypothetical protein